MGKKKANAMRKMKNKVHQQKYKESAKMARLSKRSVRNPLSAGVSKTAILNKTSIVTQLIEKLEEAKTEKKPYRIDDSLEGCVTEGETIVKYEVPPQQYLEDEDDDTYIEGEDNAMEDDQEEGVTKDNGNTGDDGMTDAEKDDILIHKYEELLGEDDEANAILNGLLTDGDDKMVDEAVVVVEKVTPPQPSPKKKEKKKKKEKLQPHSPLYFIGAMAHQSHQILELLASFQKIQHVTRFRVLSKAIHHVTTADKKKTGVNMFIPVQSIIPSLDALKETLEAFKQKQPKRVQQLTLDIFDEATVPVKIIHPLGIKPLTKKNIKAVEKLMKGFGTIIRLYNKGNDGIVEYADALAVMKALNQSKHLKVNNDKLTVFTL